MLMVRVRDAPALHKDRKDAVGRCVSPIELALGIVGDFWTPRAAQQGVYRMVAPGR